MEIKLTNRSTASQTNGRGNRNRKQTDRIHQRLHPRGRPRIRQLVRCHIDKNLSNRAQRKHGHLEPEGKRRGCFTVIRGCIVTTRAGRIDSGLDGASVELTNRGEHETNRHSPHRRDGVAELAEQGVQAKVDDGRGDDNGEGVEVGDQVVGHTIGLSEQGVCLRNFVFFSPPRVKTLTVRAADMLLYEFPRPLFPR